MMGCVCRRWSSQYSNALRCRLFSWCPDAVAVPLLLRYNSVDSARTGSFHHAYSVSVLSTMVWRSYRRHCTTGPGSGECSTLRPCSMPHFVTHSGDNLSRSGPFIHHTYMTYTGYYVPETRNATAGPKSGKSTHKDLL